MRFSALILLPVIMMSMKAQGQEVGPPEPKTPTYEVVNPAVCAISINGTRKCSDWSDLAQSCSWGSECIKPPGHDDFKCPGSSVYDPSDTWQIEEIVQLNAGVGTTVNVFEEAGDGDVGKGLEVLDSINCTRFTECKCTLGANNKTYCTQGEVKITVLARYQINTNMNCVSSPTLEL